MSNIKKAYNVGCDNITNIDIDAIIENVKSYKGFPSEIEKRIDEVIAKGKEVSDVCRGMITVDDKGVKYQKNCIRKKTANNSKYNDIKLRDYKFEFNKNPSIVLLLESPHKDEYTTDFQPIAPAQGATGKNIEKYIKEVIGQCINKTEKFPAGSYPFLVVNPVQYQASLHHITQSKIDKNKVWEKIWESKKIQTDFISRMNSYNPSMVINAGTKGVQKKIQDVINPEFPEKTFLFTAYHPSVRWNFEQFNIQKSGNA